MRISFWLCKRFYPVIAIPAVDFSEMRSEIDTCIPRDTECEISAVIREAVLKQAHFITAEEVGDID